jgi:hypothetical protein
MSFFEIFVGFMCIGFFVDLCVFMFIRSGLRAAKRRLDNKDRLDEARVRKLNKSIEVDELRKQRLERDLVVVENRAHLVASQTVKADLAIEAARRELGYPNEKQANKNDNYLS